LRSTNEFGSRESVVNKPKVDEGHIEMFQHHSAWSPSCKLRKVGGLSVREEADPREMSRRAADLPVC
jgi:hypothetical protein